MVKAEEFNKRIDAVSLLHSKLDKIRNLMDQDNIEEECPEIAAMRNEICSDLDNAISIDDSQTDDKMLND